MHTRFITRSLLIIFFFLVIVSCSKDDENNPAKTEDHLVGTYKTATPVLIKIQTDFCSSEMEDVATIKWDITWKIVKTATENVYQITMTYISSDFTVTNSSCTDGVGYAPEPTPMYLNAAVNGNEITIEYAGDIIGTFGDEGDSITGDLEYSYCYLYCQKISTDVEEILFYKQ